MTTARKVRLDSLLFCMLIALGALFGTRVLAEEGTVEGMGGWQHLALSHVLNETPDTDTAREINRLGREGWELVAVENFSREGTTTKTVYYFKKRTLVLQSPSDSRRPLE